MRAQRVTARVNGSVRCLPGGVAHARHVELILPGDSTGAASPAQTTLRALPVYFMDLASGTTGMATVLITHDLSVLVDACDKISVMYAGKIVEEGFAGSVFQTPKHPYTKALGAAFPEIGDLTYRMAPTGLGGDPPDPMLIPSGCSFHPRCPVAFAECSSTEPILFPAGENRRSACLLVDQENKAAR